MSGTEAKPGAPPIELPAQSGAPEWAMWANGIFGVIGLIAGAIAWFPYADRWTIGAVVLVTVIWLSLLIASKSWSSALRQDRSVPLPDCALVWHQRAWRLPSADVDGIIERVSDEQELEPPWWFGVGAGVLISIGLAGTFLGLTMGLMDAVPKLLEGKHTEAVNELLAGAQLAFLKSLAGIVLGTLWTVRMGELRALGLRAQAALRRRLTETFPPLTQELLLADANELNEKARAEQSALLTAILDQACRGFTAQETARKAQTEHYHQLLHKADRQHEAQGKASISHESKLAEVQAEITKALAPIASETAQTASHTKQMAVGLTELRSGEEASVRALISAVEVLQATVADAAKNLPDMASHTRQMAVGLTELRGGEEASVTALISTVAGLQATVADAANNLPDKIGSASGRHIGEAMRPTFGEVTSAVKSLSRQGGEAISQTFKDNVGQQATELAGVMGRLTLALEQLPTAVENSGKQANQKLEVASEQGAAAMTTAAARLSRGATESAVELRKALDEVQALVGKLQQGGDALHGAFSAVATPLKDLPSQLEAAGNGVKGAATAFDDSVGGIRAAGLILLEKATSAGKELREGAETAKTALIDGSGQARRTLEQGATAVDSTLAAAAQKAGAALERHAADAGAKLTGSTAQMAQDLDRSAAALGTASGTLNSAADALRQGGDQLSGSLTTARRQLGEGFTAELQAIRGALATQLTAQNKSLEGAQAHHALMQRSAEHARQQVESLGNQSALLVSNIDTLRSTCDQTAKELQAAAGHQQQGAGDAVKELLAAVKVFSTALGESQGAVHEASLKVVASTEQVTAEAARRVAVALSEGANTFEASMARVTLVGAQLDGHGASLKRNVEAAERAARALEGHGAAMLRSATDLKAELVGVVKPLNDARMSLEAVPDAVDAAVTAMETERDALTGLGASLSEQVALVREEERQLSRRAEELRGLTRALGGEIAKHVERISGAQEKVQDAWSMAMNGVDTKIQEQYKHIANYAGQVEAAVGLRAPLNKLNESLGKLSDDLEPLFQLPKQIHDLQTRVDQLNRALAPEDR
jgi:hypothetical protein